MKDNLNRSALYFMKKLLSIAILAGLAFNANASKHSVITNMKHSEQSISFKHELLTYNFTVDNYRNYGFKLKTNSLSVNIDDISYRRDFNLSDVYKIPEFKTRIDQIVRSYERSNGIKVEFELSYSQGFKFIASAKSQKKADSAAKEVRGLVEVEVTKMAEEYFHHTTIGDASFFDYKFALKTQASVGQSIYRKTQPIVSLMNNPLDQLQFYLDFVQAIPYDYGELEGHYFRTPLAVLMDNKGDCDEKALLLVSILEHQFPDREVAILAFKNIPHAIAVIESEKPMSLSFSYEGKNYIPLETTANMDYGVIGNKIKEEIMKGAFYLFSS